MTDLLAAVPHFNFSENIMGVLVGKVGRRGWDEVSDPKDANHIPAPQAL